MFAERKTSAAASMGSLSSLPNSPLISPSYLTSPYQSKYNSPVLPPVTPLRRDQCSSPNLESFGIQDDLPFLLRLSLEADGPAFGGVDHHIALSTVLPRGIM